MGKQNHLVVRDSQETEGFFPFSASDTLWDHRQVTLTSSLPRLLKTKTVFHFVFCHGILIKAVFST